MRITVKIDGRILEGTANELEKVAKTYERLAREMESIRCVNIARDCRYNAATIRAELK